MILILVLYALFGSSFPISKKLLTYTSPLFLTGIRMFIAGTLLLLYQYFYAHEHFRFRWKNIWYYLQIIIFGIYLTYILRFWGLAQLSPSKTAFLFNMAPFFSSMYSYFVFNEKLTRLQWVGLGIGFMGLIPILISTSPAEQMVGEFSIFSWAELAVLAAVAAHSYSWIVVRKLIKHKNYAATMINGMSMFAGGALALLTSFIVEGTTHIPSEPAFFGWLAIIIVISNIICHNLYGFLLRRYTATFLSFAGFLGPIFAAGYGWLLAGERITWHFYVAGIIVFCGLYLFYHHELKGINPENDFAP